jgi:murein DD-endopeptidase MepM/ murein hydrolase activator NlpD
VIHRIRAITTGLALVGAALAPAVAQAAASAGGGVAYAPTPKVAAVKCVKNCAPKRRIQGGSAVRITGRNLDGVTRVVFKGGTTAVDDQATTVRARTARSIVVAVPVDAQSGPVMALAGEAHSDPTKPVRILPPPPPVPNVKLSPAPGPRDAGAPALETATSTARWFLGAQRDVTFSYRLGGTRPADVQVDLVRQSDGAVVQTWTAQAVAPGTVQKIGWDGTVVGQLQPEGRYAFRATVHDGSITARNAAADDAERDVFDFHAHYFPVRGRHDFGEGGARFGAGRSGHTHQGQDVMAPCGTKLVAAQGGTVKYAAYQSAAGYYLVIHGLDGNDNSYMHLAGPSPFEKGDQVFTGQQIGIVGDTGDATACHLHFEIWTPPGWYDGGDPIDPLPALEAWDRFS